MSANKYTDEELIQFYSNLAKELGRTPTQKDVNEKRKTDSSFPSTVVLSRRFGFNKLAELCGLKANVKKRYSKEESLDKLKEYYNEFGRSSQNDLKNNSNFPSTQVYEKYFGGINNALIEAGIIDENKNYSLYKNLSDDDIYKNIRDYYLKNGSVKGKDLTSKNNLPTGSYLRKRFGSLENVYEKCGIIVDKKYFSQFKKSSDKELLDKLKWYYENVGYPTNRNLQNNFDMPSYTLYYERFGSIREALDLLNIEIPSDRMCDFDREPLSDSEMLELFKLEIDKHLLHGQKSLMTIQEINEIKGIPGISAYYRRFESVENLYSLIGYDYHEFNTKIRRKDMVDKYLEIEQQLNRTPTSRDIESFSKNRKGYYSMSSYEFHFGSVRELQILCGFNPTGGCRYKTDDEMVSDLQRLQRVLNRTPVMMDLYNYDWIYSPTKYGSVFGGFSEALIAAGMESNTRIYCTKRGTKCLSSYEFIITEWFEDNGISYNKEVPYKDVIENDETARRFDWVVDHDNEKYCIEMFGIVGNEKYDKNTSKKMQDCNIAEINLIALYPNDLKKSLEDVFYFLKKGLTH